LTKQYKNILNYIIGPVLFIWLAWSIYQQIQHQQDVQISWNTIKAAIIGDNSWKFLLVVALMLVNWGIEARKWQLQVKGIQTLSFIYAFKAILAGQALGFNTINRMGESAGRVAFLKEGNRIRGIVLSFVGSMAQIIATFILGIVSLLYMRTYILDSEHQLEGLSVFWLDGLIYVLTMGIFLFILAYFRMSGLIQLLEKISFVQRYKFFLEKLEDFHWKELMGILSLSFGRYFVFLLQYLLLLQVFNVPIFWLDACALVGVMFLVLAIVPTIALAELGFRGKVSILLLGMMSDNTLGIIATAAGIWIINLILPAIAGTLFILGVRLFRNK
jgi:hypothetical protein